MGLLSRLKLLRLGDPYGRSADRPALIEIDLDHKKRPESAGGDEPERSVVTVTELQPREVADVDSCLPLSRLDQGQGL